MRHPDVYGQPLTPRELEVLVEWARLGSQKAAASRLGIGLNTAKTHLTHAYRKLGADSGIAAFRAMGWLRLPDRLER